jgi:hypothetical protein
VDARAVLQPGVDHRAELVYPPAERREDPLDRVPERPLGGEADAGALDPAAALDVDQVVAIHHHLLHRRIRKQLLERAESDRLAQDQLAEAVTGGGLEDGSVLIHQLPYRLRQRRERSRSGCGLGAAALDQAVPELPRQLVQMSAADALIHPGLSAEGAPLSPA